MNIARIVIVVSLMSVAPGAFAGGLVQKVPPDGSWVTYHVNWRADGDDEKTGTLTIRMVGTEEVDGQKCRWIEFEESLEPVQGDPARVEIVKFLVPESKLGQDKDSFRHVVRLWMQWERGGELLGIERYEEPSQRLAVFLPASPRSAVEVAARRAVPARLAGGPDPARGEVQHRSIAFPVRRPERGGINYSRTLDPRRGAVWCGSGCDPHRDGLSERGSPLEIRS